MVQVTDALQIYKITNSTNGKLIIRIISYFRKILLIGYLYYAQLAFNK